MPQVQPPCGRCDNAFINLHVTGCDLKVCFGAAGGPEITPPNLTLAAGSLFEIKHLSNMEFIQDENIVHSSSFEFIRIHSEQKRHFEATDMKNVFERSAHAG